MALYTTNFNLTKPQLTDPADITAMNDNWDILDDNLSKKNISTYTELSQFGLSDESMSTSDLASNIDKIITTLDGNAATLMLILQNDINPNLHASVIAKLNRDTTITFDANSHFGWIFIRFSGEAYRPVLIETNLETEKYYDSVWTCVYNKGSNGNEMSAFKSFVDDTSYLHIYTISIQPLNCTTYASMGNPIEFQLKFVCSAKQFKQINLLHEQGVKIPVDWGHYYSWVVNGNKVPSHINWYRFDGVDSKDYLLGTIRTWTDRNESGVTYEETKFAFTDYTITHDTIKLNN